LPATRAAGSNEGVDTGPACSRRRNRRSRRGNNRDAH